MFIAAQIFGILVLLANIISMQMNNKKQIILMFVLINILSTISFLLLQSYSGAIICMFAILQAFINNLFENKDKQVPKYIIGIYIIISIILGIVTYKNYIDIVPIMCSILYTLIIIQNKEKNIRRISLLNMVLWILYDIVCQAYTAAISDFLTIISTIIGMYRFDYKKSKEEYK